ncbi:hypothetical protein K438DRAFT_1778227 [Mycena galopus ATCC 62051]|nr:hypothetical protein K438DRAFT_1778227 [Mycena galopus ATCC 62051]
MCRLSRHVGKRFSSLSSSDRVAQPNPKPKRGKARGVATGRLLILATRTSTTARTVHDPWDAVARRPLSHDMGMITSIGIPPPYLRPRAPADRRLEIPPRPRARPSSEVGVGRVQMCRCRVGKRSALSSSSDASQNPPHSCRRRGRRAPGTLFHARAVTLHPSPPLSHPAAVRLSVATDPFKVYADLGSSTCPSLARMRGPAIGAPLRGVETETETWPLEFRFAFGSGSMPQMWCMRRRRCCPRPRPQCARLLLDGGRVRVLEAEHERGGSQRASEQVVTKRIRVVLRGVGRPCERGCGMGRSRIRMDDRGRARPAEGNTSVNALSTKEDGTLCRSSRGKCVLTMGAVYARALRLVSGSGCHLSVPVPKTNDETTPSSDLPASEQPRRLTGPREKGESFSTGTAQSSASLQGAPATRIWIHVSTPITSTQSTLRRLFLVHDRGDLVPRVSLRPEVPPLYRLLDKQVFRAIFRGSPMAQFIAPIGFAAGLEAPWSYSFLGGTLSADRFIERASRADVFRRRRTETVFRADFILLAYLAVSSDPTNSVASRSGIFKLRKDPPTQLGSLEACLILLLLPPLPSVIEFTRLDKSTKNLSHSMFTIQAAKRNHAKDDDH